MITYWSNFAKFHNPNGHTLGSMKTVPLHQLPQGFMASFPTTLSSPSSLLSSSGLARSGSSSRTSLMNTAGRLQNSVPRPQAQFLFLPSSAFTQPLSPTNAEIAGSGSQSSLSSTQPQQRGGSSQANAMMSGGLAASLMTSRMSLARLGVPPQFISALQNQQRANILQASAARQPSPQPTSVLQISSSGHFQPPYWPPMTSEQDVSMVLTQPIPFVQVSVTSSICNFWDNLVFNT